MIELESSSTTLTTNSILKNPIFENAFKKKKIKIVAPASGTSPELIETLRILPELDLEIPSSIINSGIFFHACNDDERFQLLENALFDVSPNVIIWTLRGGYGSARLIDKLALLKPPKQEKIFIGFSDNTALHLFLSQKWHWQTIHGAGFAKIIDPTQDPQNYLRIAEIVANKINPPTITNLMPLNKEAKSAIELKGLLTGGNLTLVETSIGTPWQIQTAGKIVFLEEVGEKGYRIDRSLNHLRQAGLLKDVKAILFGAFTDPMSDNGNRIAIERFAQETTVPIFKTDQFGHEDINYPLIYNCMSEIMFTKQLGYELIMSPRNQ